MVRRFNRYWNYSFFGSFVFILILLKVLFGFIVERIFSILWRYNLGGCGKDVFIQKGNSIRYPGNVFLKNNISIGRNCIIDSEFYDSELYIESGSQINNGCSIDFSGGIKMGKNVVISQGVTIMSHNHGNDPHSRPYKIQKIIGDNAWVGSSAIILPKVECIGENSVIAAGSIVTKNVPRNVVVAGNPAKIISGK
jgi:hypothetical protein